ncbi:Ulp1 protease family [Abeliophyllum distichum]|uniref:Ulp1 protease family n=1 Tax=Abeliophyllum distichum TaxID=126358 RepID=A0ABD1SEY5_9LAMI
MVKVNAWNHVVTSGVGSVPPLVVNIVEGTLQQINDHDCGIFVIKTVRAWINQNVRAIDDNFDSSLARIYIISQLFKYGIEKRVNSYEKDPDLVPRKVRQSRKLQKME